ncbi:tumor necrosis factor ligand superfamily member 12 [Bufo gargarizans]|uniref:tumor necrosis factor ligand superfamily member 12 n=1 Tax=Bufo gargarizans TaxID=30331 RepID=UPI001CF1DABB|nr:tumor necrosis factor ligand superfamily member 12 [Bufo gargarizans]
MSRWSKKRTGRGALLPLLLLALALGGTSLVLASLNLLLTTTAWGQNLCHGRAQQQRVHPLREPSADTRIYYQNVWEKHQLLYQKLTEDRRRHRRSANGNRRNKQNNRKSSVVTAAHYEDPQLSLHIPEIFSSVFIFLRSSAQSSYSSDLQLSLHIPQIFSSVFIFLRSSAQSSYSSDLQLSLHIPQIFSSVKLPKGGQQMNADDNGTILHWSEVPRNSTSPVRYDDGKGEFMVNVKGLFYLYCQVHFNEDRSSYIKLDLLLDGNLIFRCLQEFSATAASIRDPKLKTCSVSGLVVLRPGHTLRIKTLPKVSLKVEHFLTYFGLFQVH